MTKPKIKSPCPECGAECKTDKEECGTYARYTIRRLRAEVRRFKAEAYSECTNCVKWNQEISKRLLASNREMRKAIFTRECGMCPEHTPKACKRCSWWEFTKGIKA